MQPNNPCADDLAKALTTVNFSQFQKYSKQLFEKVTLEVLIHGNWLIEHANDIVENIKLAFKNKYHDEYAVQCPVIDIMNKKNTGSPSNNTRA